MADDIKILVVDDELIVIKSAERVLKAEGYDVEGAISGKEAITLMEQKAYDLVLTNLKMPEVDGITLIKWIRKSRPDTGVVVIADSPSQDTIKEALELGIIDYVPKPFTPAKLAHITRRALEWIKGKVYIEGEPKEEFTPSMLNELDNVIKEYRNKPGSAIPVLQRAQGIVGYLPPVIQKRISRGLNIPKAEIHSIVSFYSFFTMKPRGDHVVRVCLGTACYVKGIEAVIEKLKEALKIGVGETTEDRKFSLESVRCLGACGLAPVMVIGEDTYGRLTAKKAVESLRHYGLAGVEAAPTEEEEVIEEKEG